MPICGILFFSFTSCIERLQWIDLAIPSANNFPSSSTLYKFPASWLGHVQPNKANVFWFPSTRQQIVWDMLEMWLYACGVVEGLVVTEMCERFGILFELCLINRCVTLMSVWQLT